MSAVFLIGFMGAGKSTVGRIVAQRLGEPFVDLDEVISESAQMPISDIFATQGEPAFRELEAEVLAQEASRGSGVIACGGGIVERAVNREVLSAEGLVVYLRVSPAETLARVGTDPARPLLQGGPDAIERLLSAREGLYTSVADVVVDTVGKSPQLVADEVVAAVTESR